ncbi:hypothetical protein [Xylanimonas allomyrinae]|uniref:hypothetical protein n=1 Tax=Xylanimonas allomyrinae TaxID=2509459 RepID=UPI0013A612FA|nr:hypothetical protein [Xylanimonas allomyrinae]
MAKDYLDTVRARLIDLPQPVRERAIDTPSAQLDEFAGAGVDPCRGALHAGSPRRPAT